ncbi:MAG: hypothetical protein M9932_14910 [Xanthobacteraceae bacterium]|nr:hypothetical protein [Xanthobacteraceae bacterium]
MTDEPAKPVFEIRSDIPRPRPNCGPLTIDDSEWIAFASEGIQFGKFSSRIEAAMKLAKLAKGHSEEATRKRFLRKFKAAGIE